MSKFTLTAKDLEDIAPTLSAALPHPLTILFDDVTYTTKHGDAHDLRHISRVVEAILRLAASTPAARPEAARILTITLTDWATATFER